MDPYLLFALACYAAVMLGIGIYGFKNSTDDVKGYILGGRNVGPKVTALSAGASDMSGWMLMGLPGAMFLLGFETIWIAIGLLSGALLNYMLVAPRLRVYTEVADDAVTLPDFFAKRFGEKKGALRLTTALIAIIFFTLYTSAGLVAGGKLFESVFGLPHYAGVITTISIVVLYTLLGGFLAVSMTDFVQGSIMFVALIAVPIVAAMQFSDWGTMADTTTQWIAAENGLIEDVGKLALLSSLAWGLGYFGQPHILVRFMAIRNVVDLGQATRFGISWMFVSLVGAVATGFVGIAYVQKFGLQLADPETIFIRFSEVLFHPLISGFLLSAILAAIMSTISSQLLVSSSSVTEDVYKIFLNQSPDEKQGVLFSRIAVFAVAVVATLLALNPDNSVLGLVGNAWAGFGAAFGPLVILSLYWPKMTKAGALAGIITGATTVLLWISIPESWIGINLSGWLYEIVPGFIASTIAIITVSKMTSAPRAELINDFHTTVSLLEARNH